MDNEKLKKCGSLKIFTNKYEKNSPETFHWRRGVFKILEEDAAILDYDRSEIVRKIFPEKIFNKIREILTFADTEQNSDFMYIQKVPRDEKLVMDEDELPAVKQKHNKTCHSRQQHRVVGSTNPYLNFFHRSNEHAAIWRKSPTSLTNVVGLEERARIVTELIAVDFVKWLRKIKRTNDNDTDSVKSAFEDAFGTTVKNDRATTGESKQAAGKSTQKTIKIDRQQIDHPDQHVRDVIKMFDIDVFSKAACSLMTSLQELPSVTKSVAHRRAIPEKYTSNRLRKAIERDLKISKNKTKLVAFGKCLPEEMKQKHLNPANTRKWKEPLYYPKELGTMETVWAGITNLTSTKSYCKWLMQNPHLKRAPFLIDNHMFDIAYHSHSIPISHASIDSVDFTQLSVNTKFVVKHFESTSSDDSGNITIF